MNINVLILPTYDFIMLIKTLAIILVFSNALASDGKSIGSNTDFHHMEDDRSNLTNSNALGLTENVFIIHFQDPSKVGLIAIDSHSYAVFGDYGVLSRNPVDNTLHEIPGSYVIKADLKASNLSYDLVNGPSFFRIDENIIVGDTVIQNFYGEKIVIEDITYMMDVFQYDEHNIYDPSLSGRSEGHFAVRIYLRIDRCEFRFALMHYSYNTSTQTLNKWILSPIKGFGSFKRILGNSPELGYAVRYNCDYKDFDLKWLGGAEFEMTWKSDH